MKPGVGRAAAILFFASAAASLSMHACKEPTQVTVEIKTLGFKCSELRRISIVIAKDHLATEEKWKFPQAEVDARTSCKSDDEVGTIVITPSGDRGAVMVLASYTETPCAPPDYFGCIVARRRFSFVENVPLRLPITLEASCKDVPCDALSSCRSGACVSSEADCSTDGTCATPAEPVVTPDGSTVPPPADATLDIRPNDAFVPPDAPLDSGFDSSDGNTPIDSGGDGGNGTNYGNICPATATDCTLQSKVCCAMMFFSCGDAPKDGGATADGSFEAPTSACSNGTAQWFPCTGRKHCAANMFCCGVSGSSTVPYSACGVPGGAGCTSGAILCNTNDDCPAGSLCNQIHMSSVYPPDGGNPQLKKCGPP